MDGCNQTPEKATGKVGFRPGTSRILDTGSRIQDSGSRILDPGSRIQDSGSRIQDPGSRIPDPGSRVQDAGSRIPDPGSWIQDPGSRILDPGTRNLLNSPWQCILTSRIEYGGSRVDNSRSPERERENGHLPHLLFRQSARKCYVKCPGNLF